jgi:hypothetical protein
VPTEVKGVLNLRKALKKFAPDLAKETQKELGNLLKPITNKARGFIPSSAPLSGWGKASITGKFPRWDSSAAKRGIGYKTTPSKPNRQGYRALARIVNASAAGAIYETAGRKSGPGGAPWIGLKADNNNKEISHSLNPRAGAQFIAAMPGLVNARPQGMVGNNRGYKQKGRLIFRAAAEEQGKAMGHILKALEKTATTFKRRTEVRQAVNG